MGRVYGRSDLEEVAAWCEERRLHLVWDEVYALSVFGDRPFVSGGSLRPALGPRAHLVWAFSKDFAASGLRCGVLVSENEDVLRTVDGLAYWSCCSGDTQALLEQMLADEHWVERYLREMRARLGAAYREVVGALAREGIPFLPGGAGFFVLVDVRRYLPETTWEEEQRLWSRLLTEGNVNLTPGSACRLGEPGFLRLCFAGQPAETVAEGVRRLGEVVSRARRGR